MDNPLYSCKKILLFIVCVCTIPILCISQKTSLTNTTSYRPPYFSDSDRTKKIKSAIPVIEKLYKDYARKHQFPGFVFGVVADGKLVYSGSTGYTDVQAETKATFKSVFRIASMSKSVTALAIVQLRDAGKLNLDDPAGKYIPQLKNVHYLTTDAAPITIRNLLTHSAGLPEDNPWGDRQLEDSDKELIRLIESGLHFSSVPGIAYEYSNLGFALLGQIITTVSGKPYQHYITETILKPSGMNSTYWEYTKVPLPQLAHGYRRINGAWQEETLLHDGAYGAMGGLLTTIEDFSKYVALHLTAWPPKNDIENGGIRRSSIREMHQPWQFNTLVANYTHPGSERTCPLVSSYGYGLRWTRDCDGRITVGHSGGLPGFGSNWIMLPDYGIGVLCFSNLTYAPTSGINLQVMDTLIRLAELKPRQLPPSSILKQRQSELVRLLPDWKGAERSGLFAENFFPDYSIDSLRKEAINVFQKAGKILSIKEIIPENNLRGSFIIEGEKSNLLIRFTLTPENPPLIQEYGIREVQK